MINLAIAEDNPYSLAALEDKLAGYPQIKLKHKATNGSELLQLLEKDDAVDLVLMDIEMSETDGIAATGFIKERYPRIKVVIVTIYDNDESIFRAIRAGADSYILKETKAEKIFETINDTLNGGAVMSPSIAVKALQALKHANLHTDAPAVVGTDLSGRETEVLECLSAGLTNKGIAGKLSISPFTVKRHIENIYQKLHAQTRVELVDKGRRKGLI